MFFLHDKITEENIKRLSTATLLNLRRQIKTETHGLLYSSFPEERQDEVIVKLNILGNEIKRRREEP